MYKGFGLPESGLKWWGWQGLPVHRLETSLITVHTLPKKLLYTWVTHLFLESLGLYEPDKDF